MRLSWPSGAPRRRDGASHHPCGCCFPTSATKAITAYFKGVCEAASGCLFEIAQREVGTIFGDYERGRHYVRLAKEAADAYWTP
jgi:hypothetical protein